MTLARRSRCTLRPEQCLQRESESRVPSLRIPQRETSPEGEERHADSTESHVLCVHSFTLAYELHSSRARASNRPQIPIDRALRRASGDDKAYLQRREQAAHASSGH